MIREFPLPAGRPPAALPVASARRAESARSVQPELPAGPARSAGPAPGSVRDAATVMLLRDSAGGAGVEVFVFRRVASMAFAAGMHVFPGGAVEPSDRTGALPWTGPPIDDLADALGEPPASARALVAAAVRETFEECGVLLALRSDGQAVDTAGPAWERRRVALVRGGVGLAEVLADGGAALAAELLRPWAHWVTPPGEARRFAARFFVAALPPGQDARDLAGEGEQARWVAAADLADAHRSGRAPMLPPTLVAVQELARFDRVAQVLATRRRVRAVMPWVEQVARPDGAVSVVLRVDLDGEGGGRWRDPAGPGPA